jgi:ketosteroid isomerase-like protein
MSQENVEIVRAVAEAFQRGDYERPFDFYDSEIEWDTGPEGVAPGMAGVYRGYEGTRDFWRRWLSAWGDLQFEIQDVRDAGDEVVLLVRNQRQWGRHSGIATELQPYGWVFTVRGGKIVRARWYPDQESALEAAGLRE